MGVTACLQISSMAASSATCPLTARSLIVWSSTSVTQKFWASQWIQPRSTVTKCRATDEVSQPRPSCTDIAEFLRGSTDLLQLYKSGSQCFRRTNLLSQICQLALHKDAGDSFLDQRSC